MATLSGRERFLTVLLALLCFLTFSALISPAASAQGILPLYTVQGNDSGSGAFRTIDPLTGVTLTNINITLTGKNFGTGNGLAKHPTTGEVYAILNVNGQTGRELVKVNTATGVATDIGNTGHVIATITFRKDASNVVTLYGVAGQAGAETNPGALFTLSTTTAAATFVKNLPFNINGGETLAFNPVDGLLYHNSNNTIFETIDPVSLTETNIALSGDAFSEGTALTYWAGNIFLMGDLSNNLSLITTTGFVKGLSHLDHTPKGLVFGGTIPSCTPLAALYGTANNGGSDSPSLIYTLNPASGAASLIGPTGFGSVNGIAFNSAGTLFGTGERLTDGTDVLITINPCTGLGTEVGPTQITSQLELAAEDDISFRKSDGVLFAFARDGATSRALATLNTSTGAIHSVGGSGSDPNNNGDGIAFNATNTLYQADRTNLNTLSTTTGARTLVAALSYPSAITDFNPFVTAMSFQPVTGTLFASVAVPVLVLSPPPGGIDVPTAPASVTSPSTTNYLGIVNTTTGAITLFGIPGTPTPTESGITAIAFSAAVASPPATITAISGTPQSQTITFNFGLPLKALVKDGSNNPVAGVTVTFTPPASGPSVTFAGGVNTAVTDATGTATSTIATANTIAGPQYTVNATVSGVATPAPFLLTNTAGFPTQIAVTAGTPQSAIISTAYATPLQATVKDAFGNVTPGAQVTFTPPGSGASGSFTGGNTVNTNASGVATANVFTANGTTGAFNVIASIPVAGKPADFTLAAATSASFALTNVDYAVVPVTTTQTVTSGGTANYSLNFNTIAGPTPGTTTFSCQGLPLFAVCHFTPASFPPNTGNTTLALAITTSANSAVVAPNSRPGDWGATGLQRVSALLFVFLTLSVVVFAMRAGLFVQLRVSKAGVLAILLLVCGGFIAGCGGAGTGYPPGGPQGTPPGNYTITVVGTDNGATRSTTVTLVVQ